MKKEKPGFGEMYDELEKYEKNGVCILMDGYSVSPMQVVKAHMAREHVSYMRDYEVDEEGRLDCSTFRSMDSFETPRMTLRPGLPALSRIRKGMTNAVST